MAYSSFTPGDACTVATAHPASAPAVRRACVATCATQTKVDQHRRRACVVQVCLPSQRRNLLSTALIPLTLSIISERGQNLELSKMIPALRADVPHETQHSHPQTHVHCDARGPGLAGPIDTLHHNLPNAQPNNHNHDYVRKLVHFSVIPAGMTGPAEPRPPLRRLGIGAVERSGVRPRVPQQRRVERLPRTTSAHPPRPGPPLSTCTGRALRRAARIP